MKYCGMYNWTNDIPSGSKQPFLNALDHIKTNYTNKYPNKNIRILEIGVFAGTSLISMLERIPNSIAVAVDNWSLSSQELQLCNDVDISMGKISGNDIDKYTNENVKKIFYENLRTQGMDNRVYTIEHDSTVALRNLIRQQRKFSFIYVDGSHDTIDTMADLVLAWELLDNDGMFVIDDYKWSGFTDQQKPRLAIDVFLNKYIQEYILFHKDYRVFLIKI